MTAALAYLAASVLFGFALARFIAAGNGPDPTSDHRLTDDEVQRRFEQIARDAA